MITSVFQAMLLILFTLCFVCTNPSSAETGLAAGILFQNLTDPSVYNKWIIPPQENDTPLELKFREFIYHIKAKETSQLKVSMNLLLEVSWEDLRLCYDQKSTKVPMIPGQKHHLNQIWVPKVFFTNKRETQMMSSASKNEFVVILPSGHVFLTTRLRTEMTCGLHLAKFPFDQQICELALYSWNYNSSKVNMNWVKHGPIQFQELKNNLAEFDLLSMENEYPFEDSADVGEDGRSNTLVIRMRLARRYGFYFINYYLPSILIVIISWVAFWLDPSALAARVTLGSSTMLTFIQLSCLNERRKISQFMANDIWAMLCTVFIFLTLAEFAFVNTIHRKGGAKKVVLKKFSSKYILRGGVETAAGRARLRRSSSLPSSPEIRRHFAGRRDTPTILDLKELSMSLGHLAEGSRRNLLEPRKSGSNNVFSMSPPEIACWIDDKSKIVFPIAFLICNCIYWIPLIIAK